MKRFLLIVAALALLGWLAISRFGVSTESNSAVAATAPETIVKPPPRVPDSPSRPTTPSATIKAPEPVKASTPTYPQMSLDQVLGPNNLFYDALFGVSVTYPEGWAVRDAKRWSEGNRQNTVFFSPPPPSKAIPSMYYQQYPEGTPAPGNTEAYLRDVAQKKEDSRSGGGKNDYKNDPGSFVFREIEGRPTLSYFATFTQGDQVMAEYFMRILGQTGYVMFFVRGPAKDVQAQIPTVHQMGGTVRIP